MVSAAASPNRRPVNPRSSTSAPCSPAASASPRICPAVRYRFSVSSMVGSSSSAAGFTARRPSATAWASTWCRTVWFLRTVAAALDTAAPAIHRWMRSGVMSDSGTDPNTGRRCTSSAERYRARVEAASLTFPASQDSATSPKTTLPTEGFTYAPVSFCTSTVAANSRASRVVLKPRRLVCVCCGVR